MPGLIDRMIMREVLRTLAVMLIVLLLLLFANTLIRALGKVAAGSLSLELLWHLVGVNMLQMLTTILPPALFFAMLWTLSRMEADHELAALAAAGVGEGRLYRSLFLIAVPIALLVGFLVMVYFPQAKAASTQLQQQHAQRIGIEALRPGVFNEFQRGRLLLFFEHYDPATRTLRNLFAQHRQGTKEGLVIAGAATLEMDAQSGERFVVLRDGQRYEGFPGRDEFTIASFETYGIRIPELSVGESKLPDSALSTAYLWRSDDIEERAALQYRIAFPLSVLAFTLLSIPFTRTTPRSSRHWRLVIALLGYAIYLSLLRAAEEWMAQGITPAWIGVWWLPATLAATAGLLVLLRRARVGRLLGLAS